MKLLPVVSTRRPELHDAAAARRSQTLLCALKREVLTVTSTHTRRSERRSMPSLSTEAYVIAVAA